MNLIRRTNQSYQVIANELIEMGFTSTKGTALTAMQVQRICSEWRRLFSL